MGGNHRGDALSVSRSLEKILRTGIAYASADGNTILTTESQKRSIMIPATGKNSTSSAGHASDALSSLSSEIIGILDSLQFTAGILIGIFMLR